MELAPTLTLCYDTNNPRSLSDLHSIAFGTFLKKNILLASFKGVLHMGKMSRGGGGQGFANGALLKGFVMLHSIFGALQAI